MSPVVQVEAGTYAVISPKLEAEAAGDQFHRGVVLYTGVEALPFGKQMHALPITALWQLGAQPVS